MKYAMRIEIARHYGRQFAAWGWHPEEVGEWLIENGYAANRLTTARIHRAYEEQKARG